MLNASIIVEIEICGLSKRRYVNTLLEQKAVFIERWGYSRHGRPPSAKKQGELSSPKLFRGTNRDNQSTSQMGLTTMYILPHRVQHQATVRGSGLRGVLAAQSCIPNPNEATAEF